MAMRINYEEFQAFYPMPDDVAQSILISETESNIHLRPTHSNVKRLWLFNKLIKNLLTNRKTIIYLTQASDYALLEEFLIEHHLQKLAFTFTHSRSNNEKNLLEFSPIIVSGSLKNENLKNAITSLESQYFEFYKAIYSIYKKTNTNHQSLSKLISLSIIIRQSLKDYSSLLPDTPNINFKELIQFRKLLPEAIPYAKLNNNFFAPFKLLNRNLFSLFSVDESWATLTSHIHLCNNKIKEVLNYHNQIKDIFYQDHLIVLLNELMPLFEKVLNILKIEDRSTEDDLNLQLLTTDFTHKLNIHCKNTVIENVHTLVELEQLQIIIQKEVDSLWVQEKSKSISTSKSSYAETLLSSTKYFQIWLAHTGIISLPFTEIESIHDNEGFLRNLLNEINHILQLGDYYPAYFNWIQFSHILSDSQLDLIQKLQNIPTQHWDSLIHLLQIEKQIQIIDKIQIKRFNKLSQEFYHSIDQYKNEILPYINYQYESLQHKAIEELSRTDNDLYTNLKILKSSVANLTDQYSYLPKLAEIFPILILDNVKSDYLTHLDGKVWDELIFMDENPNHQNLDRLKASCHRLIHLSESQNSSSIFNIAMVQAPPENLQDIFNSQSVTPFHLLNELTQFIFYNIDKFDVWINSKELILSFLPQEWNEILNTSIMLEYNNIKVSGEQEFERIQSYLSFKPTRKKIFIMDQLFSHDCINIQQLTWQKHFLKCLSIAGFEIINFELEKFSELRFTWNHYFRNELYHQSKLKPVLI